ncbi:MAG TPA: efflux RND transporter periplasmic adaptor subunit [candidate division Zixibacteria bacterium]|nr:efflux RND transporter periplasmic adaptor subunit [candidate division Zixibacteria bacterium]
MKKAFIVILILFVILAILFVGRRAMLRRSGGAIEVQTETVGRRNIAQVVTAFGRLSPEIEINISTKVIGQIEAIYVVEGDTVERGDTLVKIEQTRYIASLNSAQASLRSARTQVDRVQVNLNVAMETFRKTEAMFEKNLVSEDALIRARTQVELLDAELASARDGVERARAVVDEARDNLDQTILTAPVSGVVVKLDAEAGENVITGTTNVPGSSIMIIAQLEAMEAVVDVDEADVVDLEVGQEAKIEVDAFPNRPLIGKVAKIANRASLQSIGGQQTVANFEVRIAVQEPHERIRPGMSCSAEIEVARADSVIAVPIQAVVSAQLPPEEAEQAPGGTRMGASRRPSEAVFVVEDGVAVQKLVQTGIADDRYIEIKSGLDGGEKVVIGRYRALRELKDGDRIREEAPIAGRGAWDVRPN